MPGCVVGSPWHNINRGWWSAKHLCPGAGGTLLSEIVEPAAVLLLAHLAAAACGWQFAAAAALSSDSELRQLELRACTGPSAAAARAGVIDNGSWSPGALVRTGTYRRDGLHRHIAQRWAAPAHSRDGLHQDMAPDMFHALLPFTFKSQFWQSMVFYCVSEYCARLPMLLYFIWQVFHLIEQLERHENGQKWDPGSIRDTDRILGIYLEILVRLRAK